jgi:hypothetical protein
MAGYRRHLFFGDASVVSEHLLWSSSGLVEMAMMISSPRDLLELPQEISHLDLLDF